MRTRSRRDKTSATALVRPAAYSLQPTAIHSFGFTVVEVIAAILVLGVGLIGIASPELSLEAPILSLKSPKSRLQEYTQRRSGERPEYRLLDATGPDHEKSFRIEVWVDGEVLGVGEGPSRRIAETAAAAQAIERIRAERIAVQPRGEALNG